jgi:GxxExxY protein
LESSYEECLCYELTKHGLNYIRQQAIPFIYDEIRLNHRFRADIIIENKVIIEIKSVECFQPIHSAQLLTYLKLTNIKLGLLINFNSFSIKEGIKRIVNKL